MTQNIPESRGRSLEINTRLSVRLFFFLLWDLFYLKQKGSRQENRLMEAGGAFLCPAASRMFLQGDGWEFKTLLAPQRSLGWGQGV